VNTRDVFGRETVPVVTIAEAAAHDQSAREEFAIPERVLMENAGRALALITHSLYPTGLVVGVAGAGHNGGDTVIALRTLKGWGRDVALVRASARDHDPDLQHGAQLTEVTAADVMYTLTAAAVVLDGILGTGASGPPRERAADLIRAINAAQRPVVAVDLPSGVNADTGALHDDAVNASVTVTFGFPKLGLLFYPARAACGRLLAVDIAFPPLPNARAQLITSQWALARSPRRPPTAHKGTSGRLLLMSGSKGMAGAAVIAGSAAVRSGAGLVRIASAAENREIVQKSVPEATFFEREGIIDVTGITAIVAGPGMGATDYTRALLFDILAKTPGVATLLDADALNVLAGDVDALARIARERPILITPHPKEMSRLTGDPLETITQAPLASAQQLANATGASVLLKGQPSIIAAPGAPVLINTVGSSDFAVAGMGDQLAGVIGAMLAAGLEPRTAGAIGLFYSGRAGDIAGLGRSLMPSDVTDHLARAFAQPGPTASTLGFPFITFDQPPRW
jgi:NAD(P)H-hydrate epimerase